MQRYFFFKLKENGVRVAIYFMNRFSSHDGVHRDDGNHGDRHGDGDDLQSLVRILWLSSVEACELRLVCGVQFPLERGELQAL